MTDDVWYPRRIAELEDTVAELTEMLTAATDTATQRGKRIDAVRAVIDGEGIYGLYAEMSFVIDDIRAALNGD